MSVAPSARYTLVAGPRPNMARLAPMPGSVRAEWQGQSRALLRSGVPCSGPPPGCSPRALTPLRTSGLDAPPPIEFRHWELEFPTASHAGVAAACSALELDPRLRQNSVLSDPLASNSSTRRLTSSRLRRCRLPPAWFFCCMRPLDQKMGPAARWG